MQHLDSIWKLNEKQLKISGFNPLKIETIQNILKEDIWKRDVIVAESGFSEVIKGLEENKSLNIFVGYSPGNPHLGYLIMNRILKSFRNNLNPNVTLGVNLRESMNNHNKSLEETLQTNKVVENVLLGYNKAKLTRIYDISSLNEVFVQKNHEEVYFKVVKKLTPIDFRKIMGWSEKTPLFMYENICRAISGMFYLSSEDRNSNSLSFIDIKHLPFARLAKIASKKLGLKEPSFLITRILPSLTNENQRMSSKGGNSTIYLFKGEEELNKYLKVRSGGRAKEEQKLYGGNPNSCLALKIATLLIPSSETNKIVYECQSSMKPSCKDCKKIMGNYIKKEMSNL